MSPLQPEAAAHTEAVVADIARRYAVDGVHLDYVRYPSDQFDYSRFAIAAFRADMRPRIRAGVRRELDAQDAGGSLRVSRSIPRRMEGVPARASSPRC